MSWWKHFENEVPQLARLGVTQVWLPPPNKATSKVCTHLNASLDLSFRASQKGQGYDAYDLVNLLPFFPGQAFLSHVFSSVGFR